MIRNMDRHWVEETKEGIEWSMWQAEQLKALEKYKQQNRMTKAETAVLRMANDKYRKAIFSAQVYDNSGAGTCEKIDA